jgi:hypothetical protein
MHLGKSANAEAIVVIAAEMPGDLLELLPQLFLAFKPSRIIGRRWVRRRGLCRPRCGFRLDDRSAARLGLAQADERETAPRPLSAGNR